jgi:hypothetical protein
MVTENQLDFGFEIKVHFRSAAQLGKERTTPVITPESTMGVTLYARI